MYALAGHRNRGPNLSAGSSAGARWIAKRALNKCSTTTAICPARDLAPVPARNAGDEHDDKRGPDKQAFLAMTYLTKVSLFIQR